MDFKQKSIAAKLSHIQKKITKKVINFPSWKIKLLNEKNPRVNENFIDLLKKEKKLMGENSFIIINDNEYGFSEPEFQKVLEAKEKEFFTLISIINKMSQVYVNLALGNIKRVQEILEQIGKLKEIKEKYYSLVKNAEKFVSEWGTINAKNLMLIYENRTRKIIRTNYAIIAVSAILEIINSIFFNFGNTIHFIAGFLATMPIIYFLDRIDKNRGEKITNILKNEYKNAITLIKSTRKSASLTNS